LIADASAPTLSPQDIATKRPRDDASDKAQNKKLVIRPVAGPSTTAAAVISSNESIVQDADKEWEDLKAERIKALQASVFIVGVAILCSPVQNARNSTQAGMDGLLKIGYKLNDATEERWMAGKADRIKLLQVSHFFLFAHRNDRLTRSGQNRYHPDRDRLFERQYRQREGQEGEDKRDGQG